MEDRFKRGTEDSKSKILNSLFSSVFATDLHNLPFKKKLASQTAKSLNTQRTQHEQLCDVTIYSSTKTFLAHRCLLAAVCPYFNTLFTSSLIALKNDTGRWRADLSEFSSNCVELLLCIIYNDIKFDATLFSDVDMREFLQLLDFTGLDDALEEMIRAVAKHLTFSSCKEWYDIALQYSLGQLETMTMTFMGANLETLSSRGHLKNFSVSFIEELLSWDVILCYEGDVLSTMVLKWISEDKCNRGDDMEKLISKILQYETYNEFLYKKLMSSSLVSENSSAVDIIKQWKNGSPLSTDICPVKSWDDCAILVSYDKEKNTSVIFGAGRDMAFMKNKNPDFFNTVLTGPITKLIGHYYQRSQIRYFVWRRQLFFVFPKLDYEGGGRLLFYRYDQCSQKCVAHGYMSLPVHLTFESISQVQAMGDHAYISVRINRKRTLFVSFNMIRRTSERKHIVIASTTRYEISVTVEDKVILVSSHLLHEIDYKADSLQTFNLQSDSIDPLLLAQGHCATNNSGEVYCCLNVNNKLCVLSGGDPSWTVLSETKQSRKLLRLFFCNKKLFGVFTHGEKGMCIIEFDIVNKMWMKDLVSIEGSRLKDYESVLVIPENILF